MTLLLALVVGLPMLAAGAVDHPCVPDPTFPRDCRLPDSTPLDVPSEGFEHVVTPLVAPLVRLQRDGADDMLAAVNPTANRVRLFDSQLEPLGDVPTCAGPGALAWAADRGELLVACRGSHAVAVVDPARRQVRALIQDRDTDGRPLLQEPAGMAVDGSRLYVVSSQNRRLAIIDLDARQVRRYIDLPGQEPRSLALTPDGRFLVVADFLAGNRTEPELAFHPGVFDLEDPAGAFCRSLLLDNPDTLELIQESGPRFMDTADPDYAAAAECYFYAHAFGATSRIVVEPRRADHDLVVVDLQSERVAFTSDRLSHDLGSVNYAVALSPDGRRVYLASTLARNFLNRKFGLRPLVNRLSVLALDRTSGALSVVALRDLDEGVLTEDGGGRSHAAIPHALAVDAERVWLVAAGSDRLWVADRDGQPIESLPVNGTPKGLAVTGDTAFVYEAGSRTVSRQSLTRDDAVSASIGPTPLAPIQLAGARLFHSGDLAGNGSFACASCHPDGHLDGLVWQLNDRDGLRTTMSLQEITESAPYHWDGSKCNLMKILEDGVEEVFGSPDRPAPCEMKALIAYIESLARPHSPYRAPDERMSDEARLGAAVFHRARFKDVDHAARTCGGRVQDPALEPWYLAAVGDPHRRRFAFNGGGGPVPNTRTTESCSLANCHAAPLAASGGFLHGDPEAGRADGFEAVSVFGIWDRPASAHDGRTTRTQLLRALEINRTHHGARQVDLRRGSTGEVAALSFTDLHFRHPEYHFDGDGDSHGYALSDALTRYMLEEEAGASGAVGLSFVLSAETKKESTTQAVRGWLRDAAKQGKIALVGSGTLGGRDVRLTFHADGNRFRSEDGRNFTEAELEQALEPEDRILFRGALLRSDAPRGRPQLVALRRDRSPIACREAWTDYPATVSTGEADAWLAVHASDLVPGTRVVLDGRVVGEPLDVVDPVVEWRLPRAPAEPRIVLVQLMTPDGMLSNTLPLPVVPAVEEPAEPTDVVLDRHGRLAELAWSHATGVTGSATRYDVFRGRLGDLRREGFGGGECLTPVGWTEAGLRDGERPPSGEAFYYVVRAQNQTGATGWGSAARDDQIALSELRCDPLFP